MPLCYINTPLSSLVHPKMFAFITAILFALALSRTTRAIVPRVDTGYAVYLGNHSLPNTAAFLGIPYAEPPVGERRFRAPLPLDTSRLRSQKGTVDATKYPDFCIQGTTGGGDAGMTLYVTYFMNYVLCTGGAGSEDCLKVKTLGQLREMRRLIPKSGQYLHSRQCHKP